MAPRSALSPSGLLIAGIFLLLVSISIDAQLVDNFYASRNCPKAESMVDGVVKSRVKSDPSLAAGLLHYNCFVNGCEASVLLDSTEINQAEQEAPPNKNSLRGIDIVDQAKSAVEAACPSVVSCADIVALAGRDSVATIGGPIWKVPTGRQDGLISIAALASANLPSPRSNFSLLSKAFAVKGLDSTLTLHARNTLQP